MKTVNSPFLFLFVQMWRYDRGRQWPVDRGHEPLCTGPHVEGAEKQGHSDRGLLAGQPGVGLAANAFLVWASERNPLVMSCLWLGAPDAAGVHRAPNHGDCPFVIISMAFLKLAASPLACKVFP